MKNFIKIFAFGLATAFSLGFVSCEDAEYDTLGVHAFVSESAANKNMKVTITGAGAEAEITACLSSVAEQDTKLRFVVDTLALSKYNAKQATSFVVLPEDQYLMEKEIVIPAGAYSASATKIHILPIKEEYIGETYALPLRLESVDGTVPVTSTTSACVITTECVTINSLPQFEGGSGLSCEEGFPMDLPQFTVEVRFQVSNTSNRNRDVFANGGSVLLRFEDPQNATPEFAAHSLVQFQGEGWYLNPNKAFTPNKWQHLALTYDGTKVTLYVNGVFAGSKEGVCNPTFKFASWMGGATNVGGGHGLDPIYWNGCKIMIAEARIWSVCRTDAQIANNMATTSAKSKGLEAYWRMNDGQGKVFEDCTGHGHTMKTSKDPVWVNGVKSTDTATPWQL